MEHLVSFWVCVAVAVEVEFAHQVRIEGVYGSFEPLHGLRVALPVVAVDDGRIDVAWKVFGDLVSELGVVLPFVGFAVVSHSTRVKFSGMPHCEHEVAFLCVFRGFLSVTSRILQKALRIDPRAYSFKKPYCLRYFVFYIHVVEGAWLVLIL